MNDIEFLKRSARIALILTCAACGTSDKGSPNTSDQPIVPPAPPSKGVPQDAAASQLARPREAFWAEYLGANGRPGPQVLSLCREKKLRANVDVAPGVAMERTAVDECQLLVQDPAPLDEVRTVLRRWNASALVDVTDQLNVYVTDNTNAVFVRWEPFVPLEQILGADGRFLVGVNVKKVLNKVGTAMRDAVTKPFVVGPDCAVNSCAAHGPRPPGGEPVSIGMTRNSTNLIAKIATTRELVPRLHALLDASLGPGQQEGPASIHVHHHDGVRYEVRDWPDHPVVDVIISPDKP